METGRDPRSLTGTLTQYMQQQHHRLTDVRSIGMDIQVPIGFILGAFSRLEDVVQVLPHNSTSGPISFRKAWSSRLQVYKTMIENGREQYLNDINYWGIGRPDEGFEYLDVVDRGEWVFPASCRLVVKKRKGIEVLVGIVYGSARSHGAAMRGGQQMGDMIEECR
jgi:hypothetical protein